MSETYYAFITVLSDSLKGTLLEALLAKGAKLGPLSSDGQSQWKCDASVLLGLNVEIDTSYTSLKAVKDASSFHVFMKETLGEVGMVFHSLICFSNYNQRFSWSGGNITLPKKTRFEKVSGGDEKKKDEEIEFEKKQE